MSYASNYIFKYLGRQISLFQVKPRAMFRVAVPNIPGGRRGPRGLPAPA